MSGWQDWERRERRAARIWAAIAWVLIFASVVVSVAGIFAIVGFLIAVFG